MKKLFTICIIALIALAQCATDHQYTITGTTNETTFNGNTVYLYDYHTRSRIDSTTIDNGTFSFAGNIQGDSIRRIEIGKKRINFIVESGNINIDIDANIVSGTPKNESKNNIDLKTDSVYNIAQKRYDAIWAQEDTDFNLQKVEASKVKEKLLVQLKELALPILAKNSNNALGAWVFWNWCTEIDDFNKYEDALNYAGDYIKNYGPIVRMSAKFEALKNTAPGMAMKDFTVENGSLDGETVSLSYFVGRGKFILVDFWASWCGPCRQEVKNIKRLYDEVHGNDFDIVSVAVWDEAEKSKAAIKELEMNWNHIVGASTEVTDTYGIDGIPHIILFAPDGTIMARDLRGNEMIGYVKQAIHKK